jgi:hypothetical protein
MKNVLSTSIFLLSLSYRYKPVTSTALEVPSRPRSLVSSWPGQLPERCQTDAATLSTGAWERIFLRSTSDTREQAHFVCPDLSQQVATTGKPLTMDSSFLLSWVEATPCRFAVHYLLDRNANTIKRVQGPLEKEYC